jgi:hypothetical protein
MSARENGPRPPRQSSAKPQLALAGLACIPDFDDLLRVGDSFPLRLSALGFLRGSGGGAFVFLCSVGQGYRAWHTPGNHGPAPAGDPRGRVQ